jgi:hypothetical protein
MRLLSPIFATAPNPPFESAPAGTILRQTSLAVQRQLCALRSRCVPVLLLWAGVASLHGQITSVGNDTATPVPGVGHDYRQLLSETVSPANGSLSVRIRVPVPQGRGVSIPFSFEYDSAGVYHISFDTNDEGSLQEGSGYLNVGGWTYGIPFLTTALLRFPSGNKAVDCTGEHDFIFTDSAGERQSLAPLTWINPTAGVPSCGTSVTLGVGDRFTGQIPNPKGSPVIYQVSDRDGTVYTFSGNLAHGTEGAPSSSTRLPTTIEDRNINEVTVSDPGNGAFTFVDSAGRSVFSSSGFGTAGSTYSLAVSGLGPYQIAWGAAIQPRLNKGT